MKNYTAEEIEKLCEPEVFLTLDQETQLYLLKHPEADELNRVAKEIKQLDAMKEYLNKKVKKFKVVAKESDFTVLKISWENLEE